MTDYDLTPCPFCESTQAVVLSTHATEFAAVCLCGAEGPECETEGAAAEAWNARPMVDALRVTLVALAEIEATVEMYREETQPDETDSVPVKAYKQGIRRVADQLEKVLARPFEPREDARS